MDLKLSPACSAMLPLGIYADDQPHVRRKSIASNLPIALFDIALEPSNPFKEDGSEQRREVTDGLLGLGGVIGKGSEHSYGASIQDAEIKALFIMLHQLNKLGVKVLACQKVRDVNFSIFQGIHRYI